MKVLVTGATGFIGSHIVEALRAAGHDTVALVRPDSARGAAALPSGLGALRLDVLDPALADRLPELDAAVHLVGIIRERPSKGVTFARAHVEATENLIRALKARGVGRLVHMSALGARVDGPTEYFRSKGRAERLVEASGLDWTVFRPSIVYGPRDMFMSMVVGQVRRLPCVPVIGDGAYRMQPVWVGDVARGFVGALERPETVGRTFDVGGPEVMSYDEMLDAVARALGKTAGRARKAHFPLGLMQAMARAFERIPAFPVTTGQIRMLLEESTCDPAPFAEAFGLEPTPFAEGLARFL